MTQHNHRTHVPGCFRCELSKDEVMTPGQEKELQVLNDKWGVAEWTPRDDGAIDVHLDDGDQWIIDTSGDSRAA